MTNLSDLHLLLTRPQKQAENWAPQLIQLGARVTCQPFLAIEPLTDKCSAQTITGQLLQLDQYQKAIFVSQNAVTYGVDWIDRFWPQLPVDLEFFAVGTVTAQLLGYKLTQLSSSVKAPQQAMNSDSLLALPGLASVAGESILIFRGRSGRTHLQETLNTRGAEVDYCELYQRSMPDTIDKQKLADYRQSAQQPMTTALSCETLDNMCHALAVFSADYHSWILQQPLVVPGQRVAQQAKRLGFASIIVATNATHHSILEALNDWCQ